MSTVIDSLERTQLRRVPRFQAGDRVKVHFQVIEGTRRRTQVFEGVVIKRQGEGVRETFTVRKQSFGVGVERTFPLHSPKIEKIEVAARGDVRRAKLYYLRGRVGKRARVRERRYTGPEEVVERGLLYDPAAEAAAEADAEVPGEAVDEQALAEAEAAETQASADAEAAASGDEEAGSGGQGGGDEEGLVVFGLRLAHRAGPDRRRRPRVGPRHPSLPRQALPDPVRVDGPDPEGRPARLGQPDRRALLQAPRRRHRRLPPTRGRRAGQHLRLRPATRGPAVRPADGRPGGRELHQARGRGAGRPDPHQQRQGRVERQAAERALRAALRRRRGVRLPDRDQDSSRALLHDGRQPWLL